MLTLIKIKYFKDVAELHSFTKAAKQNHVAQTSISQQIKELEQDYQVQLINRETTPISLTSAGEIFYQHAQKVISSVDVLDEAMQQYDSGNICIAYSSVQDLQAIDRIFSTLPQFKKKLIVEHKQMKEIAPNLEQGKVDLAITFDSEFFDTPNIETISLKTGKYFAGMRKDHPLAKNQAITVDQLYSYPLVMLKPDSIGKSYDIMLERSKKVGHKPNFAVLSDNVDSELFMIVHRNLIGFFPEDYPISQENDELKLVPIVDSPHVYKIVLAYVKKGRIANNQYLIDELKKAIAHR